MTKSTAVGSTTGLVEVAMTSFVPHCPAFIGVCIYLGWYVEPQAFVLRFRFPSALLIPVSFCLLARHCIFCLDFHGIFRLGSILWFPSNYLCWLQIPLLLSTSLPHSGFLFFFLSTNANPTDSHRVFHFLAGLCLLRKSACDVLGTCLWSGVVGREKSGRVASFTQAEAGWGSFHLPKLLPSPNQGRIVPWELSLGTNPRASRPLRG